MNFFIHTPVCCPSRSELVTGRYLHNVKLPVDERQCGDGYAGNDAHGNVCCMHVDEALVNNRTLALYLQREAGYTVGMFGKCTRQKRVSLFFFSGLSGVCVRTDLNNCPLLPPPGFDAWYANGGSTYYAPSFAVKNIVSPKRPTIKAKWPSNKSSRGVLFQISSDCLVC